MDILTLKVGESLKHRGKVIAQVVAINRTSVVLRFESGEEVELEPATKPEHTRKPRLQMLAVLTFALTLCLASSGLGADVFHFTPLTENTTAKTPEAVKAQARVHVVKVTAPLGDGSRASGSGTYLGDGLVLSAAHVVAGSRGAIEVSFPNPAKTSTYIDLVTGKTVAADRTWDQALIRLDRRPKHDPPGAPIAAANPKAGDYITFVGYPGGGRLTMNRGRFVGYASASGQGPTDWFDGAAPVVGGYSGGAAFNDQGELFGNLWGSDYRTSTTAVCTGRTKRFLFPWNAQLEAWRLALRAGKAKPMQWGQQCPNGNCQPYIAPSPGGRGEEHVPDGGSLTPVHPTPQVEGCECDWTAWEKGMEDLKAKIAAMANRPQIPGPPGPPGPQGPPGEPGDTPQLPPSAEPGKHFVVVGDPKGEYYGRLKDDVAKTATYFDAIELHPPPKNKNVGTLPAIVMYVGGQSVFTHRGVTNVSSQLYKIRNGEYQ